MGSIPIGVKPIGTVPIAKGNSTIDLFQYGIHIPLLGYGGTSNIQVRMRTFDTNVVWTLDKATIAWNGNTFDIVDVDKIG